MFFSNFKLHFVFSPKDILKYSKITRNVLKPVENE